MKSKLANFIGWFFALIFAQAFILDPVLLGIDYVPLVYVLLLIFLPNYWPSWVVLLAGFIIGLIIDLFYFSGGIHAAASLVVCFLRPNFIQTAYKGTLKPNELVIENESFDSLIVYILLTTAIHHFVLLVFVVFDWARIGWFLSAWGTNTLLTFVTCTLLVIITRKGRL
jgi:rod shape-determining protein MreD